MELKVIKTEYLGHQIFSDVMYVTSPVPRVLCMHGAGTSERKLFQPMREYLMEHNIISCALDFLGYGETGGNLGESSLKSRTEQARLVIERAQVTEPLVLIASSMSAYTAIKLSEFYPVDVLVLFVPAVYARDVYNVRFGEKFSSLIREAKSWDKTDAWDILSTYKGKLLIVTAGKDKTVPPEIPQKIYESAMNASTRELVTIPNAPHRLFGFYFKRHPDIMRSMADKIITLLK